MRCLTATQPSTEVWTGAVEPQTSWSQWPTSTGAESALTPHPFPLRGQPCKGARRPAQRSGARDRGCPLDTRVGRPMWHASGTAGPREPYRQPAEQPAARLDPARGDDASPSPEPVPPAVATKAATALPVACGQPTAAAPDSRIACWISALGPKQSDRCWSASCSTRMVPSTPPRPGRSGQCTLLMPLR
jgi:hypothetical protein